MLRLDLENEDDQIKEARAANDSTEAVVPTTFVDDAELIWRLLEGHTQQQAADIMGWDRGKVGKYAMLDDISKEAWCVICSDIERHGTQQDEDSGTQIVPTGTFTENLLRPILNLTPEQQLELVSDLADGKIDKGRFRKLAKAYRARNGLKNLADEQLQGVDLEFIEKAYTAIDTGAYDQEWEQEKRPKFDKLIAAIREEYEQKAGIQLIHGDFEVEVATIEDGTVDLIVTDPPYGISQPNKVTRSSGEVVNADFDREEEWDTCSREEFLERFEGWATQWARLMRPGASLLCFVGRPYVSHLADILENVGLRMKNQIVWVRTNPTPVGAARRNLNSKAEYILWAVKPGQEYVFNDSEVWDKGNVITTAICGGNERLKDEKGATLHPTQKPVAIIQPLIEVFSNYGEVVFDGFMGTGTTAVCAKEQGRKFIGIEQNVLFFEGTQRRLS
jgi:DNA modification methylase